jgi:hypothetical protein
MAKNENWHSQCTSWHSIKQRIMFSKCTTQINFSLCVVNKLAKVLKTLVYKASVEKCELWSTTKSHTWPLAGETIKMKSNECARCDRKREMLSLFTVHTIKRKQLTSCWIWLQQKSAQKLWQIESQWNNITMGVIQERTDCQEFYLPWPLDSQNV